MMRTKFSNSYLLECLSEEDSFSLFLKSAFEDGDEKKHPHLLEIGEEIVKQCGGLPLAVKTLGSSLFSRVDKKEWESMRDNEIWNLKQNENDILPALKLSYDQLPSYLKPCFASLAFFPEDTRIYGFMVTRLWGALGFLQPLKQSESMIDVASLFLRELWSRSFLSDYFEFGGECQFQLHDLVCDLAKYVGKGEFEIIGPLNPNISEYAQYLSFLDNNLLGQDLLPTGLRTAFFPEGANDEVFLNTLVTRCKYLRVLNLDFSEYEGLPRYIGKLKHLRYLSLEDNKELTGLPNSVFKLQNLQTLNLGGCIKLLKFPKGITNLINLRNLGITTTQPDFPDEEIASLASLETLRVRNCDKVESLFKGIQFPNLKYLILGECESLKSVSFHAIRNVEVLVITQCNKLKLSMGFSSQIDNLRLKFLVLMNLPQLVTLPLWLQGFVNTLYSLAIMDCINLEELPEYLSTMICFKFLSIGNCTKLLSLPDSMYHLEELQIIGCPELYKRYQPEDGQDWHKISHIKQVLIDDE